ncbi:MAG: tRNA (adenosine(37)-N6)-dimethylallyltransferase MiaA [Deltaproteobacteria bacterium]|nr:tRNA (adenosine(37)-N6)-dimethylallyltransferase MiaA [Deltaproteobacteria bacterium]
MKSAMRAGFIVGPTAVGKSSIAIQIAEQLGAEIVNADSRQVYRGMDIGTAKPRADELRRVPHHLIDIRDPDAPFDVAEFAVLARTAIVEIAARGRPVLVVGGSGLYLRAIRGGIFPAPPASSEIRARITNLADEHGVNHLFERLHEIDPTAAAWIKPNDLKRIVRALEVYEQTGVPISEHQRRHHFAECPFDTLTVGLTLPREILYRTIDQRFDAMVEEGLVGEVRRLLAKDYDCNGPSVLACVREDDRRNPAALPLSTIGYREIAGFLRGEMSLAEAIARAKRASRRLAKRQLTWFRADPEIIWLDAAHDADKALKLFQNFFSN